MASTVNVATSLISLHRNFFMAALKKIYNINHTREVLHQKL